jgi:hypothetical protein
MLSLGSTKTNSSAQLIDHVLQSGQISRQDHLSLMSLMLSARNLSATERQQINQIFDALKVGKLHLVD